jgi:branched-subunit amino acid ABC-type transport system permease component
MLAVTFETFRQLTVDGFFRGCSYGLLGVGFALILGVTGRFHFAYGFTYTLAAYLAFAFTFQMWEWPFWPSAIIGILLAGLVGAGIERGVYRPLARKAGATALLAVFVAALGIGIAGENLIRLHFGANTKAYFGPRKTAHVIWDAIYINFDWWQGVSAIVITLLLAAMLRYTGLGRQIKATRVNPDLAKTIGIDADRVYVIVFFLGTLCAGVAAFWYALKYTVDPGMGTLPITYAFVVAFLGGTARSPIRVFLMGIVVALIEQYASIWLSVQYTQTAVFVVLVGYLTYLAIRSSAFMAKFKKERPATPLVPATAGEG